MRRFWTLLALLWAAGAVPARAQVPWVPTFDRERWGFGLGLGPAMPGGSAGFGETSKLGFGWGLEAQRFITPSWSLGLEIASAGFDGAKSLPAMPADGSFRVAGAKFMSACVTTRLNAITNESWTPYLGAGVGFAQGKSNILVGDASAGPAVNRLDSVETKGATVSARVGFEFFQTRGLTWFVEGRWQQVRLDAQSGGTGVPAAALSFVQFKIGARLWMDLRPEVRR